MEWVAREVQRSVRRSLHLVTAGVLRPDPASTVAVHPDNGWNSFYVAVAPVTLSATWRCASTQRTLTNGCFWTSYVTEILFDLNWHELLCVCVWLWECFLIECGFAAVHRTDVCNVWTARLDLLKLNCQMHQMFSDIFRLLSLYTWTEVQSIFWRITFVASRDRISIIIPDCREVHFQTNISSIFISEKFIPQRT
jgi:hypothetical protein